MSKTSGIKKAIKSVLGGEEVPSKSPYKKILDDEGNEKLVDENGNEVANEAQDSTRVEEVESEQTNTAKAEEPAQEAPVEEAPNVSANEGSGKKAKLKDIYKESQSEDDMVKNLAMVGDAKRPDEELKAALNVSHLDQIVDPSRTAHRNHNLQNYNSSEDIIKSIDAETARAKAAGEDPDFYKVSEDAQEHLLLRTYRARLLDIRKREIGAKSKRTQSHQTTVEKGKAVIGMDKAEWLEAQIADPESPMNVPTHPLNINGTSKEAIAYRKRAVEARNAVYSLTDVLGIDNNKVDAFITKARGEWTTEQMRGALNLIALGTKDLYDEAVRLTQKGVDPEDVEWWRFNQMLSKYMALGASVEDGINESSRLVNSLGIPIGSHMYQRDKMMQQLRDLGGKDAASAIAKALVETGGDMAEMYGIAKKTKSSSVWDALYEHAVTQGIFTDPMVHNYNIKGSAIHTMTGLGANVGAGLLGTIRKRIQKDIDPKDLQQWGETQAYAYGMQRGFAETWEVFRRGFWRALDKGHIDKNGNYTNGVELSPRFVDATHHFTSETMLGAVNKAISKTGYQVDPSVGGGKFFSKGIDWYAKWFVFTGRGLITGIDAVFRNVNRQAERNRLVYRELAINQGIDPSSTEFAMKAKAIVEGKHELSREIYNNSLDYGVRMNFQNTTNSPVMTGIRALNQVPLGMRYLTMFAQTAENMFLASAEFIPYVGTKTPLMKKDLESGSQRAKDIATTKMAVGGMYLAYEGIPLFFGSYEVDKDDNIIRRPALTTGIGLDFVTRKNMETMGMKVGVLNVEQHYPDGYKDANGSETDKDGNVYAGQRTGKYYQLDLKKSGSAPTAVAMLQETMVAIQAVGDPNTQRSAMRAVLASVGELFSNYGAASAFAEIGKMAQGTASIDDVYTTTWTGWFPIVGSGLFRRIRTDMDDDQRRAQNLKTFGANTSPMDGFSLAMEEVMIKLNNKIPSSVAKAFQLDHIGLAGSESLDPEITALGSLELSMSPATATLYQTIFKSDEVSYGLDWQHKDEPLILSAAILAGVPIDKIERTFNYQIQKGDFAGKTIPLNVDLITKKMKERFVAQGNEKAADLIPTTRMYTLLAQYSGDMLRKDLAKLVKSSDFQALPVRGLEEETQASKLRKEMTDSRKRSREKFIKDPKFIPYVAAMEAEAAVIMTRAFPTLTVPKGIDINTRKVDRGSEEFKAMERKEEVRKAEHEEAKQKQLGL